MRIGTWYKLIAVYNNITHTMQYVLDFTSLEMCIGSNNTEPVLLFDLPEIFHRNELEPRQMYTTTELQSRGSVRNLNFRVY